MGVYPLMNQELTETVVYAFGHLVSSHFTDDAHHADSGDLAQDVMEHLNLTVREREILEAVAEHVAGNYRYTGEITNLERRKTDHAWPTNPAEHVWGKWYTHTVQVGVVPPTQYRTCVYPDCHYTEYREAPSA